MKKVIALIATIILMVVCFVGMAMLCGLLVEKALLPSEYLFYESTPLASHLLAPLLIIPAFVVSYLVFYWLNKKITSTKNDFLHYVSIIKALGKLNFVIIAAWGIAMYLSLTSFTCVTENKIIVVSPFNLKGQVYNYSDVEQINAGFGNKKIALYEYKSEGSFYYKVTLDGKEYVFHSPTVNSEIDRYNDTYLELEEFDRALCELNVPKNSSRKGYEKCDFDQEYVDRFLRIIERNGK